MRTRPSTAPTTSSPASPATASPPTASSSPRSWPPAVTSFRPCPRARSWTTQPRPRTNSGNAKDAIGYQKAAVKFEDKKSPDLQKAGSSWFDAGNAWTKMNAYMQAAVAFDRAGADFAQAGKFADAAKSWVSSAAALAKTSPL